MNPTSFFTFKYLFLVVIVHLTLLELHCGESLTTFEKDVTLTESEKNALEEYKAIMVRKVPHDYMKSDLYLLKWLRTSHFNVAKAKEALMRHLKWRREQRMDTIENEDWSDMEKEFKFSLESKDKQGQPTIYYDVGGTDMRKFVLQGKGDRIVRFAMKTFDKVCGMVRIMGEQNKNVTRGILILNAKGFNPIQHGCLRCIPFLVKLVTGHLSEYPECADKIIVTNVPAIAEPLVQLARPIMEKHDLRIYGPNPKQYLDALLELYDISEIPVQLGGQKVYKVYGGDDYDLNSFDS